MSYSTHANAPRLEGLPGIVHPDVSAPSRSSLLIQDSFVDPDEGCLITKTVKHTHEIIHWVDAQQDLPNHLRDDIVNMLLYELAIVPPSEESNFDLNHPSNLSYLEAFLYRSIEEYAFFAVTASVPTLRALIRMVRNDNHHRRQQFRERCVQLPRNLDFTVPAFTNPEFELVALHPQDLLPKGSLLSVYDPAAATSRHYVSASDGHLRRSRDRGSARFPAFRPPRRACATDDVNVYLVVLNAEIKFSRYKKWMEKANFTHEPELLPDDVLDIIDLTIQLVDELHWNFGPYWKESSPESTMHRKVDKGKRPERSNHRSRSGGSDKVPDNYTISSPHHRQRIRGEFYQWMSNSSDEDGGHYEPWSLSDDEPEFDYGSDDSGYWRREKESLRGLDPEPLSSLERHGKVDEIF